MNANGGRTRDWPLTICVQALGGQGGGVLVDWIVDLAESNGFIAQSTSVAGVAQRTGATIYYLEMVPRNALPADGRQPVLAQMPVPGEIDVVIASELMEAGRAVQRGFVTPQRTTVIASSHRTYSADEKVVPGNGIANAAAVIEVVRAQARRLICDDMAALAVRSGSVISASLFGALAGSGELPFEQSAFEATVQRAGVGVDASLRALRAAAEVARRASAVYPVAEPMQTAPLPLPERASSPALQPLVDRIRRDFPATAWPMLGAGLARVVEFQDARYGGEYLDRMARVLGVEQRVGGAEHGHPLTVEAARQVAVSMAYDDVIRVADLKTRGERFDRIRRELGAAPGEVVVTEEFFHPRLDEVCATLPVALAQWIERSLPLQRWLAPRIDRGRRIHAGTVRGYLQLRLVASLRRWRRNTLRHRREQEHLDAWLNATLEACKADSALALEIVRCRQLIKGYSDTHSRGAGRFDRLMSAARGLAGRADAAPALSSLREAALRDASGTALDAQWRRLGLQELQ